MGKKNVDLLILTNVPSFYKKKLYNELAKIKSIYVVFTDRDEQTRNEDFYTGEYQFEYEILDNLQIKKLIRLLIIIMAFRYSQILIGGWNSLSYWIAAFISPFSKNTISVESSYFESRTTRGYSLIKKLFLSRISKAYVPGKSNEKLLRSLEFKKPIILTHGVGLFNRVASPIYTPHSEVKKFLYVGRFVPEKNLFNLIEVFNELPQFTLNIIGFGKQELDLKTKAKSNIVFHGAVDNALLINYYRANDVFILPSFSETWGLVVEEALNNGLPVIVSNKVGCADEIIKTDENGIVFSLSDENSLRRAILKIADIDYYNCLRNNVCKMDFAQIEQIQLNSYLS
jgi:glycosyltransferase involved in cell wall biosynthesis